MKRRRKSLMDKAGEALRALATREIFYTYENIPVRITNASYKKILNWLLVELGVTLKLRRPLGFPTFLQVEPTTLCNLRCTYCPVSLELPKATGHLDPALFEKVVDEMGEYFLTLVLWGWGEPFVSPHVYDIVRYAKKRGIHVISSTNGHLFARGDHARRLVESGIDSLIVSIGGATEESYVRLRGVKMEEAFDGVRRIVEERKRQQSSTPFVSLSMIVSQYNEEEIPILKHTAQSLGVDALSLKGMNTCTVRPETQEDHPLPSNPDYRRFRYQGKERVRAKENPCKALWQKTNLRWDGQITPCTYDFDGVRAMGQVKTSSIASIWRNAAYTLMRRQFRKDPAEISICKNCTYAFEGGDYPDIVAETHYRSGDATGLAQRNG
jgi:radical SAM protein with 4Fe4S-binding SPASM domain